MLRTSKMKLVELMILKQDIDRVLEYLGKNANFQIQNETDFSGADHNNSYSEMVTNLQGVRTYLGIPDVFEYTPETTLPTEDDDRSARQILADVTSQAGYPPLMLNPVDFECMYRAEYLAQAKAANQKAV